MLYIQMEFCPRTLKKTLVAGPIEEGAAWQVMTHMHHTYTRLLCGTVTLLRDTVIGR